MLKMGDIVQVKLDDDVWEDRIFVKAGVNGGIICVKNGYEKEYKKGGLFENYFWRQHEWGCKKEKKYRPYEEKEAEQLKGRWVKHKTLNWERMIVGFEFYPFRVYIPGAYWSPQELLVNCVFSDTGLPCGEEINE